MTTPNTVTVVVPCFNMRTYVDEAILSIRSQTYTELDIIAVNDGSTDDTPQLLDRHARSDRRVRVVSQPNRGLSAARNTGLREARGEFVCFLDADDVMLPDKIERQVNFLRANPRVDLVYSDHFIGDSGLELTGLSAPRLPKCDVFEAFLGRNWLAVMTPLLRRSLIENVGEFDETLRASEDWDYWLRCAKAGSFGYMSGAVAIYRMSPSQMHNDSRRMLTFGMRVINKHTCSSRKWYHSAVASLYEAHARYAWNAERYRKAVMYLAAWLYHSRIGAFGRMAGRGGGTGSKDAGGNPPVKCQSATPQPLSQSRLRQEPSNPPEIQVERA